ncbi:glycoside hydrolase family 19 protein [Mesorhizobium sp. M1380]|uniref:glycoside hydrolase family 19 protein n=1 Tax=Mesorhizobium sp. M1380 TaxID=2957093 RepID=UPI00333DD0BA
MSSILTAALLRKISKGTPNATNMNSVLIALDRFGAATGLDQPHRLAHFLSQIMHESGSFKYDQEIASGAAYDGRKDLGNTVKGDGKRFKGRGPMQLTGRKNYAAFTKWARKLDPSAPDFVAHPEQVNTDPWEGASAIWYWDVGNPTGKSLNAYADQNNAEMITKRVNGGLNGYADRLEYYDRAALVMLDYGPTEYERFQTNAQKTGDYKGKVDGDPGPQTRAALHARLVKLTAKPEWAPEVKAAPVTTVEPVAVPVKELEKPAWQSPEVLIPAAAPVATGVGTFLSGAAPIVAITLIVVVAAFAAFLIIRRDRMKSAQAAKVETINAQGSL